MQQHFLHCIIKCNLILPPPSIISLGKVNIPFVFCLTCIGHFNYKDSFKKTSSMCQDNWMCMRFYWTNKYYGLFLYNTNTHERSKKKRNKQNKQKEERKQNHQPPWNPDSPQSATFTRHSFSLRPTTSQSQPLSFSGAALSLG
jgi:hypothetical protein